MKYVKSPVEFLNLSDMACIMMGAKANDRQEFILNRNFENA